MRTHAGSTTGTSAGTERRTCGSGSTSGWRSIASDGWFARISRGAGQCGASSSHSASTASRSPTTDDDRRPACRASAANAATAARARSASSDAGTTGTRFAPAQHTASKRADGGEAPGLAARRVQAGVLRHGEPRRRERRRDRVVRAHRERLGDLRVGEHAGPLGCVVPGPGARPWP